MQQPGPDSSAGARRRSSVPGRNWWRSSRRPVVRLVVVAPGRSRHSWNNPQHGGRSGRAGARRVGEVLSHVPHERGVFVRWRRHSNAVIRVVRVLDRAGSELEASGGVELVGVHAAVPDRPLVSRIECREKRHLLARGLSDRHGRGDEALLGLVDELRDLRERVVERDVIRHGEVPGGLAVGLEGRRILRNADERTSLGRGCAGTDAGRALAPNPIT